LHEEILKRLEASVPELVIVFQPAARLPKWGRAESEPVLPPPHAPPYQPGLLQHLHVLGNAIERDGKPLGQHAYVDLAIGEDPEHDSACGIRDRPIDPIESSPIGSPGGQTFNHTVEYRR
jgi:hypothetical protein